MTDRQKTAIKCAYLDLIGALQAKNQQDVNIHDWKAHRQSIVDLESEFDFVVDETPVNFDEEGE